MYLRRLLAAKRKKKKNIYIYIDISQTIFIISKIEEDFLLPKKKQQTKKIHVGALQPGEL